MSTLTWKRTSKHRMESPPYSVVRHDLPEGHPNKIMYTAFKQLDERILMLGIRFDDWQEAAKLCEHDALVKVPK